MVEAEARVNGGGRGARRKGGKGGKPGRQEVQDWSEESSPEPSCVLLPTHPAFLPFPPLLLAERWLRHPSEEATRRRRVPALPARRRPRREARRRPPRTTQRRDLHFRSGR